MKESYQNMCEAGGKEEAAMCIYNINGCQGFEAALKRGIFKELHKQNLITEEQLNLLLEK